jgi:hypothetical protein
MQCLHRKIEGCSKQDHACHRPLLKAVFLMTLPATPDLAKPMAFHSGDMADHYSTNGVSGQPVRWTPGPTRLRSAIDRLPANAQMVVFGPTVHHFLQRQTYAPAGWRQASAGAWAQAVNVWPGTLGRFVSAFDGRVDPQKETFAAKIGLQN